MRDIFDEIFVEQPLDPVEAARRSMRPALRKRFYRRATVGGGEGGFQVLLDDRPVRTPARRGLAAPTRPLAEAIAAEWDAQREQIDPAIMPLTRLANSTIDGVEEAREAVKAEIGKYLVSDLLFYRADQPQWLVDRQAALWDPVIGWMRNDIGARFVLAQGVMHVAQPEQALAAVQPLIPEDAWRLGAVHAVTTLTGSALLALALLHGRLSAEAVWAAAHVDEDWNLAQWGDDPLSRERRAYREAEMQAAGRVLELL
ncbi:MAG: ATPase [Rhizobiales bacterium]|nr:ATPase [Hyphomicrobiales bacterium]